jgi:1-acyl-sn-glycerol-3-phosphate acyltransferase
MLNWILKGLSYPRSVLFTLWALVFTLFMSVVVLAVAVLIRVRKILDVVIIYGWSRPLVWPAGVRVEVRGAEHIRKTGKGFLILFNHSSLYDIPVLYGYFPRSFRFGAKIELFKIPLFGPAMRACGVLPIDRGNRNKVMQVYDQAISRIHNGECFALAPEGTRQDGIQLGKFKRGPFEFAINAQSDVVPVVLAGALKVLPKHSVWANMGHWRQTVILQITPPIAASEYTIEQSEALQERVRSQMEPVFNQLNAELGGF